jgi:hypothetical protein
MEGTMMRYRTIVVAVLAGLLSSSGAYAMFSITPLPDMVKGPAVVVKVKVLKIEQPDPKRSDRHFITLEVEKILAGKCDKQIPYFHGGNTAYWGSPEYEVGEECYLCLIPDAWEPGRYREINFGHSKFAIKDGKIVLWERIVPENLKKRIENLTPQGFEDLVKSLRGPTITIKPAKESFSCDEPIEFTVTVKNETAGPMVLIAGDGLAFGAQCDLMLWDAQGFPCTDNWVYGGYKSYDDNNDFPDDQTYFRRRLEVGSTFTASVRFHLRLDDFQQDPERARVAVLRYLSRTRGDKDKDTEFWGGPLQTSCAIRLTCPYPRWAENLRKPSKTCAVYLMPTFSNAQVVLPKQGIRLGIGLMRPVDPELVGEHDSGVDLMTPAEVKKALASCLHIEHDGKALAGAQPDSERVRAWLATQRPMESMQGAELNVAEYWKVDAPGVYRVRFVLPDKDGDARSNVVQFTVPEKNAP